MLSVLLLPDTPLADCQGGEAVAVEVLPGRWLFALIGAPGELIYHARPDLFGDIRRSDRLFDLIQILRDGQLHTARQLAERVEVSERTIYRDMEVLAASGVPLGIDAFQIDETGGLA